MRPQRFLGHLILIAVTCLAVVESNAHPSWGIAVDRRGQVYFSDLRTVWKIDIHGKLSEFRAKGAGHVHELKVDEEGNVYGAENTYEAATERFFSAIWKMTPAGEQSYILAPTESPPKGTSIWNDRSGNTYLTAFYPDDDLLVLKRARNGTVSTLVGNQRAAQGYRQAIPYGAGGIAVVADGSIYFAHGANISKITAEGRFEALDRNTSPDIVPGASKASYFGIATDAQGNVVAADYGKRRVIRVTPDKKLVPLLSVEKPWHPTGVAVRGNDLYILELGITDTHEPVGTRVRKLSPGTEATLLAVIGESGSAVTLVEDSPRAPPPNSHAILGYSETVLYGGLAAVVGLIALSAVRKIRRRTRNSITPSNQAGKHRI
jgi:hypothetical protein